MPEPVIILSHPQLGENIGSVARVMSNFGISELRIVSPRDSWPNPKAYELAANGSFILDQAVVFESLENALSDITYLYGTSAQGRCIVKPAVEPKNLNSSIFHSNKVGFLFGRERSGLTNEELVLCDAIININSSPLNPSLNIAQAVAIIAYEYFMLSTEAPKAIAYPELATKEDIAYFFKLLETELDACGFFRNQDMKHSMLHNICATFIRASLTQQDVKTLVGIIKSLVR